MPFSPLAPRWTPANGSIVMKFASENEQVGRALPRLYFGGESDPDKAVHHTKGFLLCR
jgi:hypothetical protein